MKLNNKGFSLVELMIAIMISTIVLGSVTALIIFSSNSTRMTNAKVNLQNQAKDAFNHIESYCLEAVDASWNNSSRTLLLYSNKEHAKAVSSGAVSLSEISSFDSNTYAYWFAGDKIYFGKCSSTDPEALVDASALPSDDVYLLADKVEDFNCKIEKNEKSGKYTIKFDIIFKDEVSEYHCEKLVYYRNQ